MARKAKVSAQEIVGAAMELIRSHGQEALNARRVAAALGCSTQPVFSNFSSMEALKQAVIDKAFALYLARQKTAMEKGDEPPYRASGLAYIRFAQEETHLFRLLFMRDRKTEVIPESNEDLRNMSAFLQAQLGLSTQEATLFHLEMWVCVHGIASMIATDYLPWDQEIIRRMLSDQFHAMRAYYANKE